MKRTMICIGVLALGGCGGGGGGPNSSNETATTTISGAVSLLTPVPSAATGFIETGDPVADSLTFINYQRVQLGLPKLTNNAAVATAAVNHSTYLYDNNQVGHYETAGLTGYTGNSPQDRIDAAYSSNATGEILIAYHGIKAFPSSSQPIQALFEAPFHRGVALDAFLVSGVGYKQSGDTTKVSALTMDFAGETSVLSPTQMIASPYNGQTNVNTSWYASESPSPFEANPSYNNTTVGYPVLLSGGLDAALTVSRFTLATAAGVNVPCQEMDESVDGEAAGMAVCTPYAPLATSTSYIATAVGTVTKSGGTAQAFNLQWEFTTAPTANVPYDAPSRLSVSATVNALTSASGTALETQTATAATASAASTASTASASDAITPSIVLPAPQRHLAP